MSYYCEACKQPVPNDLWGDQDDDLTPEIVADHPAHSGAHDTYAKAMDIVGRRRSKGALVNLVNHLLLRIERVKKTRPKQNGAQMTNGKPTELRNLSPMDLLNHVVRARSNERDPANYEVFERTIDALREHSEIREMRQAVLDRLADDGQALEAPVVMLPVPDKEENPTPTE